MKSRNKSPRFGSRLAFAMAGLMVLCPAAAQDDEIQTPAELCLPAKRVEPNERTPTPFDPDRILVRFKPGVSRAARAGTHDLARGRRLLREYQTVSGLQLVTVRRGNVLAAVAEYQADPNVLYAEPDYKVCVAQTPDDPHFALLWGLHNTGQTVNDDPGTPGADIGAVLAWDGWTGDPDFRIAVIDTGVDYSHPDLAGNIWTNTAELYGSIGVDDDANGYIDDIHGYDFYNGDGDPMDDGGHGSHVSGTIGAVGNDGLGVVGVNWSCRIVGLKFLPGSG